MVFKCKYDAPVINGKPLEFTPLGSCAGFYMKDLRVREDLSDAHFHRMIGLELSHSKQIVQKANRLFRFSLLLTHVPMLLLYKLLSRMPNPLEKRVNNPGRVPSRAFCTRL